MSQFDFIDLCAGIGGLRIPFESRKKENILWGDIPGKCVWTSEMDDDACSVYAKNFSSDNKSEKDVFEEINRDFTIYPPEEVPDHQLLLAGFPCQPFSQAGKRRGRTDERGRVFDSIEHIIAAKKPKVVLLENVKGLRSLRNPQPDETFVLDEILLALARPRRKDGTRPRGLSYFVPKPVVLNARDFGLAQNRQRLFILAIRQDIADSKGLNIDGKFTWPEPTFDRNTLKISKFLDEEVDETYTISEKLWESHKRRKEKNKASGKGFGYQAFKPSDTYVSTISARYFKDGAEALILQDGMPPRKLTPREGANLQGFPVNFVLHASKMKAFKQLGNAVPVPVVSAIARNIWNLGILTRD
jgi:DNA (cytosine-5)-methyltransferase 1